MNKRAPKVFVLNWMGHDLSDAKRFTQEPFVVLTQGAVPLNRATLFDMAQKLRDFQPEDFLLISGSATLAVMATSILKDTVEIDVIKILVYKYNFTDPKTGEFKRNGYVVEHVDGFVEFAV